jgi:hypothetical protein
MGLINSASFHLCHFASDFKDVFSSASEVFFWQACGKSVISQQHFQVTKNVSGRKHIATLVCLKI